MLDTYHSYDILVYNDVCGYNVTMKYFQDIWNTKQVALIDTMKRLSKLNQRPLPNFMLFYEPNVVKEKFYGLIMEEAATVTVSQ